MFFYLFYRTENYFHFLREKTTIENCAKYLHLSFDYRPLDYVDFLQNLRACLLVEVNFCQTRFYTKFDRMIRLGMLH